MQIEVTVQRKHLTQGLPQNCAECPISLAVKDLGYPYCDTRLTNFSVESKDGTRKLFAFGKEIVEFIKAFDSMKITRDNFQPFSFIAQRVM